MQNKQPTALVWIDPNFSSESPIMQRFCASIDFFKEQGWEIEVWCARHDASFSDKVDRLVTLPAGPSWAEGLTRSFLIITSLRLLWEKMKGRKQVIYHATKGCAFGVHVGSHNFSGICWVKTFVGLKHTTIRDWLRIPITLSGVFIEYVEMHLFAPQMVIANSDGLQQEICERYGYEDANCAFIKNQILGDRFSIPVRDRFRAKKRAELGFQIEDFVFMFVSQGHMSRKGWFDAVLAIEELRRSESSSKNVRFYSVGFNEKVRHRAEKYLNKTVDDWREWLIFLPPSKILEEELSAVDCFLFPSYFDSCANVVQEACAMGLPCVIGDYFGAKLLEVNEQVTIIRDRSTKGMASLLQDVIRDSAKGLPTAVDMSGAACSPGEWASEVNDVYLKLKQEL